jgi:excisionase family DNA binding protein
VHTACSIPEACRRLGISRTTLYGLINEGVLPARKLGKRTIFLNDDIDSCLANLPLLNKEGR